MGKRERNLMSSRFNSFTESRAHDRLASRFGGFGDGGGVFPDPGDCIVAVSPPFIYDWFTGEGLPGNPPNPDWRIYSFDVDMVRVNYVEVGRTQEEEEAGFRRMGGFYGGKGVYWAMGQRIGPIDNGRHNVWDIGYELNQYGSVVQRYEMTAHRLIVYPDYQGPLATGGMPGGSGNIGNKAGLCWGSLARRVDRRAQFSYGLRRFAVPHMEWEDAVDIDTPDDLPLGGFRSSDGSLTVSTLDGEAGYALAPWDVGYRVPFFRNPFRFDFDNIRQRAVAQIFDDELFDRNEYFAIHLKPEKTDKGEQVSALKGGKNYVYSPCYLQSADVDRFPRYRIGIARGFVDWDRRFFELPLTYWNAIGLTDIGTNSAFNDPFEPWILVAGD